MQNVPRTDTRRKTQNAVVPRGKGKRTKGRKYFPAISPTITETNVRGDWFEKFEAAIRKSSN